MPISNPYGVPDHLVQNYLKFCNSFGYSPFQFEAIDRFRSIVTSSLPIGIGGYYGTSICSTTPTHAGNMAASSSVKENKQNKLLLLL